MPRGSLIVVGTGIKVGAHCTAEARAAIEHSDVVYSVAGDAIADGWLERLNPRTVSLHRLYGGGRTRQETYEAMTDEIVAAVLGGNDVCAVFYGHPGVFVHPSHAAVRRIRDTGRDARILPGVSAEDCLFADLGVDPGQLGCQSYEATDFLIHARRFDPSAMLILWQIAVVGDRTLRAFDSDPRRLRVLADVLMEDYPPEHVVVVYEAASLPVGKPGIQRVRLSELHDARVTQESTLYVPPLGNPQVCPERLAKLDSR